ncbi:hypothetical protein BvCmsF52A_02005 [Escherichia coli]|nr:hypothetical protein BvCmsF52A_02005 [Escherichia coli]
MVTSPGSGLFSHQRFLTVLRFQPVAVKMSRYKASVLPNPSFLQVMRSRAALQDKALGGEYPFRMATWNLRLAMEKEFPDEEWRSADLRKILMEMAKDGTVSKDTHASRIGQAVWRLEVR